jgi:hypothetical protein
MLGYSGINRASHSTYSKSDQSPSQMMGANKDGPYISNFSAGEGTEHKTSK